MAQKQFKIGLSNTDKQNMAQDVYERLLALTFNEYDTTTEYEVGDFVVYNDQLYKCIGATSGAWDSTKWQLATLNDLVDDIENAVAFVNDKANVDGNYPTMTVGVADQLSPYDKNSGDDQDEPFSFQATGTGNGTQPDFATGSIALMKEKQGNTVVVNQQVRNPNFANTLSWDVSNGTLTAANNVGTYKVTTVSETAYGNRIAPNSGLLKLVPDHKYLFTFSARSSKAGLVIWLSKTGSTQGISLTTVANTWVSKYDIVTITSADNIWLRINNPSELAVNDEIDYKDVYIIDLTQWFNGDIPQDLLDNPENFFRYYQGSLAYNEGELVNSNGRYLKTIGRNQWDEDATSTGYIDNDGNVVAGYGTRIASSNYIKIIPNTDYYFRVSYAISSYGIRIAWYDKDKNLISVRDYYTATNKSPSNACYMRFNVNQTWYASETYNHDITISIYYEGESGYNQYYPYEVLANNDTGTETLRSAGSVKDTKTPDGTITRRIGYVDLGTLDYTYVGVDGRFYTEGLQNLIKKEKGNLDLLCSKFISTPILSNLLIGDYMWESATGNISFSAGAETDAATFKTAMSGVYLFYELAEPTTEQGTPYSENLVIDDFGSMDFGGTNGVPQGALIFYPVDYKAFVDTLYNYTDGTPSNIALKSDVASEQSARESVDTQLQNAVGGTLRQCLAIQESDLDFGDTDFVDLGTLSWSYNSGSAYHYASISGPKLPASNGTVAKMMCSKYRVISASAVMGGTYPLTLGLTNDGYIVVKDTSYTDATTFKNDMKGVLLAYEKASE